MSSEGNDFIDDIVQDELPVHIAPPPAEFLPWHRVRKEYVRRHQWNEQVRRMIKRFWRRQLQMEEFDWLLENLDDETPPVTVPNDIALDHTLRCLVIPGDDLLDVRSLVRDVADLNCWIRYLGFHEGAASNHEGTRVHIASNAVLGLPRVFRDSRVIQDRFEAIHSKESQAYRYLKDYGPFHVVNLDMCGSMFPNTMKHPQDYYNALHRLLEYQFANQRSEWLLFITTMIEPATVDSDGLRRLCGPTTDNVRKYREFGDTLNSFLPENALAPGSDINISEFTEEQLIKLFGIALSKWLLSLCHDAQPRWTIAMRPSYSYIINENKGAVMLSLAFALKPNISPPVDKAGISSLVSEPRAYPTESDCAIKLAGAVSRIRDVDEILSESDELRRSLMESKADLLEAAGYDRTSYIRWVESGEN